MRFLLTLLFSLSAAALFAQSPDAILGEWLNEDEDAKVTIFQNGEAFYGKVSWLKEPMENGEPRVDEENPDVEKRDQPIMGLMLLKDFQYEDGEWKGGKIYDPKNGKTYSCYMKFVEENKLKIRGFVMGMRALGRTTYWTR